MNIDLTENYDIELKEVLTFDGSIFPKIEEIKNNLQDYLDDGDYKDDFDPDACSEFLKDNLNERHKSEICCNIINKYEKEHSEGMYNVSIFDEDIPKK
jgi:hypothetical protein